MGIMLFSVRCVAVILALTPLIFANIAFKIYKNIGYTSRLCFDSDKADITVHYESNHELIFNCSRSNNTCDKGRGYSCKLPCYFDEGKILADEKMVDPQRDLLLPFTIPNSKDKTYGDDGSLKIETQSDLSLFSANELSLIFPKEYNISCGTLEIKKNSMMCRLDLSRLHNYNKISLNISVSLGYRKCGNTSFVGTIVVKRLSDLDKFMKKYYWIFFVPAFLILAMCSCIAYKIRAHRDKKRHIDGEIRHKTELDEREISYVRTQKKAFLEYQTAVDMFPDLGSLRPRYVLSFYNFVSRVFNIELMTAKDSSIEHYQTKEFREFILNKDNLINWIEKIESVCKVQQRSLISSLLAIVLFQHPEYFLEVMTCLLTKYIATMVKRNEERIVFRRSDSIIEKLVGNWITLCMYRNLKTGEVGKKFFNLFRAIKCKINRGIVDCLTNKAKYALTFDHIMLGDIDSDTLTIKSDVQLSLKMLNHSASPLIIKLVDLEVDVLSLDSISQVKEKILDRAIMVFSEKEDLDESNENSDWSIGPQDITDFRLQFMNNTMKIMLDDFDRTSVRSTLDKNCLMINTMKHYNMKSGNRFLLDSLNSLENITLDFTDANTRLSNSKTIKVHLQLPQDYKIAIEEMPKQQASNNHAKILHNPLIEEMNKEAYLMLLMATKQSVLAFIDGFFQTIFNWNPNQAQGASCNSLFETEERPLLDCVNADSLLLVSKESYLMPIYFLFSMLDDVAKSLDLNDDVALLLWKSNSLILRFWVNLIKNPNFIFSVDKTRAVDGSLTTIASVLMESCSVNAASPMVDVNIPIVKQLFHRELIKYSSWWMSFTESATRIEEENMVKMMNGISQTYEMNKHYDSSLNSLQAISNTLIPELFQLEKKSPNSQ